MINIERKNFGFWIDIALRYFFAAILIYASIDKIINPLIFAQSIENYHILGERLSRWVAIWLPYLELTIGILLFIGVWKASSAFLNMSMMTVFLVAISVAYSLGLDISCGCFSTDGETKITLNKLFTNIGYFFLSLLLFMRLKRDNILKKTVS